MNKQQQQELSEEIRALAKECAHLAIRHNIVEQLYQKAGFPATAREYGIAASRLYIEAELHRERNFVLKKLVTEEVASSLIHGNCCPRCGGPADNGFDRELPPNPYFCTVCDEKEIKELPEVTE